MMKGEDSQGLPLLWGGCWRIRPGAGVLKWRVEQGTCKHCLNLIL